MSAIQTQIPKVVTDQARKKGAFEMAFNVAVFTLFTALWLAVAILIISRPSTLDQTWESFRNLPVIAQGVLAFLFLPVVAGVWVWETTWPFVIRLTLLAGVAWWNIYVFFPFRH
jgi:hypothetical protein